MTHQSLLDEVRTQLQLRGPLGNRDFVGQERVKSYRGSKDTALALYYLWLTGELMFHHRKGLERVYDFRERIAATVLDYTALEEEAEHFFARKTVSFKGLVSERGWMNEFSRFIERRVYRTEARQWLQMMVKNGELTPVRVTDSKENWFVLSNDILVMSLLEAM